MHARLGPQNLHLRSEFLTQRVHQRAPPLRIQLPRPADMAREMAFVQEIRQRRLIEVRRPEIAGMPDRHERIEKTRWNHGITYAQRRDSVLLKVPM